MMERIDMEEMWGYVAANAGADTLKLMLKSEPDLPFDKRFAVMQIECRKKTKNKIPELLALTPTTFRSEWLRSRLSNSTRK